jgi:hypothetical protein
VTITFHDGGTEVELFMPTDVPYQIPRRREGLRGRRNLFGDERGDDRRDHRRSLRRDSGFVKRISTNPFVGKIIF